MSGLTLYGFRYSVYVRVARLALHHRGLAYTQVEVNPFDPVPDPPNPHPFGRIPLLQHGDFRLFETAAILTYLASFPGPPLVPEAAKARARMVQVQGITDAYAYWPLVRQVYVAGAFDPALGRARDEETLHQGLRAAAPVLAELETIAAEGLVLNGTLTLADLHLAPMIAAFVSAPEGAAALTAYPALSRWWAGCAALEMIRATDPGLPAADSPKG